MRRRKEEVNQKLTRRTTLMRSLFQDNKRMIYLVGVKRY